LNKEVKNDSDLEKWFNITLTDCRALKEKKENMIEKLTPEALRR
jgi:hypothetical protein